MKHELASSSEEDGGGTATIQPLPVSDELIARLAGRCEEIFPLNDRVRHEISDEEIHEMESLLKRLQPAPAKILFREQCCSLMCAESEREMEDRLKKFSASSMLEFSVCKMAYAMDAEGEVKQGKTFPAACGGSWPISPESPWQRLLGPCCSFRIPLTPVVKEQGPLRKNRKASPFRKSTRNPTVKLPSLNSRGETSACLS